MSGKSGKRDRGSPTDKETGNNPKRGNLMRSPTHGREKETGGEGEEIMGRLEKMLAMQTKNLHSFIATEIRATEDRIKEVVTSKIKELEENITELAEINKGLKEENEEMNKRLNTVERRLVEIEREKVRLNIVVAGLEFDTPKQGYQLLQEAIDTVTEKTVKVKGLKIFNTTKGKSISASCATWEEKLLILKGKKKLHESKDPKKRNIYIDAELTGEDRKAQAIVRANGKKLREQGKEVRVQFLKLKVDEKYLYYNRNTQEMEESRFRTKD